MQLVREGPLVNECGLTLGELLKLKASEGCTVLLLVWDDQTGVMGTRCDETLKFFKDSGVCCRTVPRYVVFGAVGLCICRFLYAYHVIDVM